MIKRVYKLLKDIVNSNPTNFSGIGLVVYKNGEFNHQLHCDLRPDIECPCYCVDDRVIVDYLAEIADYHNTLHDGFHMMNEEGILTHVAQYFVPPIVEGLSPDVNHGVRLHSSLCGSTMGGIMCIGVICANQKIYIFENGKSVDLDKLL